MSKMRAHVTAAALAFCTMSAFAFQDSMYAYYLPEGERGATMGCVDAKIDYEATGKLQLGKWYTNFRVCKKYADEANVPLFAVWSEHECIHCWYFDICLIQPEFKQWQATHNQGQVICCFMAGGDPTPPVYDQDPDPSGSKSRGQLDPNDPFNWMWFGGGRSLANYPFVVMYWKKPGDTTASINVRNEGDELREHATFSSKNIPDDTQSIIRHLEAAFKDWTPVPPYAGGTFVYTNTAPACVMEAEPSTEYVDVKLIRTATTPTNQLLRVSREGKTSEDITVTWGAETEKNVSIPDFDTKWFEAGKWVTLTLYETVDPASEVRSETAIRCVSDQGNSPANPLWLTERTTETLKFGEWTLDIAAVTNKVRAFNEAKPAKKAYSLILFGGSKWCPDCDKTDRFLFAQPEFKAWARDNNVALGVIDIPSDPTDPDSVPFLLDPREGASWFSDPVKSGLGYLTRKMIGLDSAALGKVVADGAFLASHNTTNGGWNDPERTVQTRPGVPIVVLVRDDGTVAGRLTEFASTSPTDTSNLGAHLKRLNELLAQEAEAAEEANDSRLTTRDSIVGETSVTGVTLSHTDKADVYRVEANASGRRAYVLGPVDDATSAESNAVVAVKLLKVNGSAVETVAISTNRLCEAPAIAFELEKRYAYFVKVETDDEKTFGVNSKDSTVIRYELASAMGPLIPSEERQSVAKTGSEVLMEIEANVTYKLTGLSVYDSKKLESLGHGDLYTSHYTGPIELVFEGQDPSYQIWKTGKIGFRSAALTVLESHGTLVINVDRTDGVAGYGKVKVSLENAAALKAGKICEFDDNGAEHEWGDGEKETWTLQARIIDNNYRYGDTNITFHLERITGTDVPLGTEKLTVRIVELDEPNPGRLALAATEPAVAKSSRVIAKEKSDMTFAISRLEGTDGTIGGTLAANGGTLSRTSFSFPSFNDDPIEAVLTLPAYASQKSVKVTMTADKGVKSVSSARKVTVEIVPEDAPEFAVASKSVQLTRYVKADETSVGVVYKGGSTLKVAKYTGTVPAGISWTFADGQLTFSGTPTAAAGTYEATFRVSAGTVKGLTTTVTFDVKDVTVPEVAGMAPVNPNVAKTKTYSNATVLNTNAWTIVGLLNCTVPKSGKVSARYTTATNGVVSFSCASWDRVEDDGTLVAELKGTTKKTADYRLTVRIPPEEGASPEADLFDPYDEYCQDLTVFMPYQKWGKDYPATKYKGYFNVSMPQHDPSVSVTKGAGYVSLRMEAASAINAGRFTYAGLYPNGATFSGSVVLLPLLYTDDFGKETPWMTLPLFRTSSTDVLTALMVIEPESAETPLLRIKSPWTVVRSGWMHIEKRATELSFLSGVDLIGCAYDKSKSLKALCEDAQTLGTSDLTFFSILKGDTWSDWLEGEDLDAAKFGVTVGDRTITADTPKSLALRFSQSTGIVSGSYRQWILGLDGEMTERTMTYRGVVMQGYGSRTCTECGKKDVESPFITGSAWYTDKGEYIAGAPDKLRILTTNVKRGCPFSIGVEPGK